MDGRVLYSLFPHSSLGRAVWTRLKLGSFYNTISSNSCKMHTVSTMRGWPFGEYALAEWIGVEKQGVAT